MCVMASADIPNIEKEGDDDADLKKRVRDEIFWATLGLTTLIAWDSMWKLLEARLVVATFIWTSVPLTSEPFLLLFAVCTSIHMQEWAKPVSQTEFYGDW